jgi:hypothetical protein
MMKQGFQVTVGYLNYLVPLGNFHGPTIKRKSKSRACLDFCRSSIPKEYTSHDDL